MVVVGMLDGGYRKASSGQERDEFTNESRFTRVLSPHNVHSLRSLAHRWVNFTSHPCSPLFSKPAFVSVDIIDYEDSELCFRPYNGTTFRCFYVAADYHGVEFRILVSVQPDRTAHIMKVQPATTGFAEAELEFAEQAIRDTWSALLCVGLKSLKSEAVAAAYVLDDACDRHWSASLSLRGLKPEGAVHNYTRCGDVQIDGNQKTSQHFPIQTILASKLLDASDHQHMQVATKVTRLLDNTIRNSEDCLLRTKLQAQDVLALFACNPADLQIMLALGVDGIVGILVGDDSLGPNRGHIEYIGVHSDFRRQAVATMMMNDFQLRNPNSALSVAVHDRNQASAAFFEQQNFGRSQQYQLWTRDI